MKTGVVVVAVGVAFGDGILTAVLLLQQSPPPPPSPAGGAVASGPGASGPPRDVRPDVVPLAGPTAQATGRETGGQGGPGGPPPPAAPGELPPPPPPPEPPPPPPALLREGERALAEQPGPHGNGQVTELVYDFESEEERQAWEENHRASWAARLQRERDIKLQIMREKVGLTPGQEPRLIEILESEGAERQRLVDALAQKQISRTSFDEQVKANVEKARAALTALLTPEQLTAYQQLKPREQVLRDETH